MARPTRFNGSNNLPHAHDQILAAFRARTGAKPFANSNELRGFLGRIHGDYQKPAVASMARRFYTEEGVLLEAEGKIFVVDSAVEEGNTGVVKKTHTGDPNNTICRFLTFFVTPRETEAFEWIKSFYTNGVVTLEAGLDPEVYEVCERINKSGVFEKIGDAQFKTRVDPNTWNLIHVDGRETSRLPQEAIDLYRGVQAHAMTYGPFDSYVQAVDMVAKKLGIKTQTAAVKLGGYSDTRTTQQLGCLMMMEGGTSVCVPGFEAYTFEDSGLKMKSYGPNHGRRPRKSAPSPDAPDKGNSAQVLPTMDALMEMIRKASDGELAHFAKVVEELPYVLLQEQSDRDQKQKIAAELEKLESQRTALEEEIAKLKAKLN